jgi:hypothetical protein
MCWNSQVSLNTFSIALFAAVISVLNNVMSPLSALFLMSYSSMQLAEFFLWKNINDPVWNKRFSMLAFVFLLIQPFMSIVRLSEKTRLHTIRNKLLVAYALFILIVVIAIQTTKQIVFKTTIASNGHLKWHWLPPSIWLLAPWIVFLIMPMYLMGNNITGVLFVSTILLVSIVTYWRDETWGTMWCWFAAIASMFYIAQSFYKSGFCK